MQRVDHLVAKIIAARDKAPSDRAFLVGVSGIDGSGKSFLAARIVRRLRDSGYKVAGITADDWLNLPEVCIKTENSGANFYEHAIRFDEMFGRLIDPLTRDRAIDLTARCGDAKATVHREYRYVFNKIDIVLLEGIFLFKPAYRDRFDLNIWIECSFETALQRAIARGQEGVPPAETERAFETIYFPAQRIHLARDNPREMADFVLPNDQSSATLREACCRTLTTRFAQENRGTGLEAPPLP